MTILVLTERFAHGGLETQIAGQVATLARHGERCALATGSGPEPVPSALFVDGLFCLRMGAEATFGELRETLKRLEDFATRHAVEVIHAHPFHSWILGALLARRLRLPWVATVHGPVSLYGITQPAAKAALISCVLPGAARVYCVSPEAAELVGTVTEAEIRLLPNAVRIPPEPMRGEPGVWAWLGRLDPDKLPGLLDLLDKLALAPPARLRIFGTGCAREELERVIATRPEIAAFARLEGWYADPMAALAGCELVAGMGRVLLEAGAAGLPCLLVGYDGVKGLLDEAALAEATWRNLSGRHAATIPAETLHEQIRAWRADPVRWNLRPWVARMRDEAAIWSAYRADLQGLPLRGVPGLAFLDDLIRFSGAADRPAWSDADMARAIEAVANPDPLRLRGRAAEAQAAAVAAAQAAAAQAATLRAELDQERAQAATLRAELDQERAQAATLRAELDQERAQAATLRAELDRERARSSALDARRNDWQYRAEAMERSTSWRVTAPLRAASTAARIAADIRGHAKRVKWVMQISRERGLRSGLLWTYQRLAQPIESAPPEVIVTPALQKRRLTREEFNALMRRWKESGRSVFLQLPTIDWNVPLFQRPQQIAMALARSGTLVAYFTYNVIDRVESFEEIYPNVFAFADPSFFSDFEGTIASAYSTASAYTDGTGQASNPIEFLRTIKRKNILMYEYIDHINEDISGSNVDKLAKIKNFCFAEADVIVASSKKLYEEVVAFGGEARACFAPNGVDYNHYSDALSRKNEIAPEISEFAGRHKAVVGYFGALAPWLWYEMINDLTRKRPDLGFVFIGPDYFGGAGHLERRPNVLLTGAIPYRELPKYARGFDVAIIPFRPGEIAQTTSPLKLFEYFALEKPVVVTDEMLECTIYPEVYRAGDCDSFSRELDRALGAATAAATRARLRQLALENTWDARAAVMLEAGRQALVRKRVGQP